MQIIYVSMTQFAYKAKIHVINDEGVQYTLECPQREVAEQVAKLSAKTGITEIKILGGDDYLASEIRDNYTVNNYTTNETLKIEVLRG